MPKLHVPTFQPAFGLIVTLNPNELLYFLQRTNWKYGTPDAHFKTTKRCFVNSIIS